MSNTNRASLIAGRKWTVNGDGIQSLTRIYIYQRTPEEDDEATTYTGLPALGSQHPEYPYLYVTGYTFDEGSGADKNNVKITVAYNLAQTTTTGEPGSEVTTSNGIVSYGWRSGFITRDATVDASTKALLLNTAGEPFENVPQIEIPSPVWTKVFKTKSRQTFLSYCGKINALTMSIGGQSCAARTVRCISIDEERLFGDAEGYNYQYSVSLQYLSNICNITTINGSGSSATATLVANYECGWQLPITQCGLNELTINGLTRITTTGDSGELVYVSTPQLLNAKGEALKPTISGTTTTPATPIVTLFKAYEEVTFPAIFTSEA